MARPPKTVQARITTPRLLFLRKPEDVQKESEEMLVKARKILDRILKDEGRRTVTSVLVPFNELSNMISQVGLEGQLLFNAHTEATVRDAGNKAYLAADSLQTELSLNRPLYEAFAGLDVSREDPETRYAVWKILRDFRRAGVDRDDATRATIKALNDEIAEIGSTFDRNINDDLRSIHLDSLAELDGLPEDYITAHGPRENGKITITTAYPDALPVLQYAVRSDVREKLDREFLDRGYPKNLEVLGRLLTKRYELARLLGYEHYAAYITEDKMIGSAKAAAAFLEKLTQAAGSRTKRDYATLLERKRKDAPESEGLDAWDPSYYIERVRAEQYRFDSQEVRPYLQVEKVRAGIFEITGQLFGIRYRRVPHAPVWHESVEVYDVYQGRRRLGRFYLDLFPREGKYSHAAEFTLAIGLRDVQLPQAALLCNFPDPKKTAGPALMEHSDVVTFFHEFGHLLHAILSGRSRWTKTSMEGIEWDFVEAPSQMLEEWARRPEGLRRFAKHFDTGEPIPEELVQRMERAQAVARGMWTTRQIYFSALSLRYYSGDPNGLDTTSLAKEMNQRYYPVAWFDGTHFQCNFGHLNSYSAVYYTYLWSLVIAKDLFTQFLGGKSILDPATAGRYRHAILEAGSARPAAEMVREFLGRETGFEAFRRWLNEGAT
jgi:thimet oligopeptidase